MCTVFGVGQRQLADSVLVSSQHANYFDHQQTCTHMRLKLVRIIEVCPREHIPCVLTSVLLSSTATD